MMNDMIINMLAIKGIHAEEITCEKGGIRLNGITVGYGNERLVCYPDDFNTEEECVNAVMELVKETKLFSGIDKELCLRWETAREKVQLGIRPVINDSKTITMPWKDLELYTYIDFGNATVKINQNLLTTYDITISTLFRKAKANTEKEYKIINMGDMFGFSPFSSYVVTNKSGVYGASVVFDTRNADKVCEKLRTDKLIIIPSSIHETIVLNAHEMNVYDIIHIVREINNSVVAETDVLSNNVYTYDRTKNEYDMIRQ